MSTATKPSAGAVRAANAINMCEGDIYYEDDIETWAEIIDRETHAGEMLEALELLVKQGAFPTEAYEKALAVIRKVRGGE